MELLESLLFLLFLQPILATNSSSNIINNINIEVEVEDLKV